MCFPDADSSKFWLSFVSSSDTSASFKDESELKRDGALRMRWVMECNILRAACLPFHMKCIAGKKMRENACMS